MWISNVSCVFVLVIAIIIKHTQKRTRFFHLSILLLRKSSIAITLNFHFTLLESVLFGWSNWIEQIVPISILGIDAKCSLRNLMIYAKHQKILNVRWYELFFKKRREFNSSTWQFSVIWRAKLLNKEINK